MRLTKTISQTPDGVFEHMTPVYNFRTDLSMLTDDEITLTTNPRSTDIIELDVCPFCGAVGVLNEDTNSWYGWCSKCGCKGPKDWDWIEACRMWNNGVTAASSEHAQNDVKEKWTFVSERYPDEEDKEYLVLYDNDEITIEKLWFTGDNEPFFSGMNIGVVAWMPLSTKPYKEV